MCKKRKGRNEGRCKTCFENNCLECGTELKTLRRWIGEGGTINYIKLCPKLHSDLRTLAPEWRTDKRKKMSKIFRMLHEDNERKSD